MLKLRHPNLKVGMVASYCPSVERSRSELLRDLSGRNNATLVMDPANDWVVSGGKVALDFDGSNDYIETAWQSVFDTGPLTLSMWFNMRTSTTSDTVFETTGLGDFNCTISSGSNRRLSFSRDWSTTDINHQVNQAFALNTWTHIAFTWNGGSAGSTDMVCYSQGVQLAAFSSITGGTYLAPSGSPVFRIGSSTASPDMLFDAFSLYNRVLTLGEIQQLAQCRGIEHETYRAPVVRGATVGGGSVIPVFRHHYVQQGVA